MCPMNKHGLYRPHRDASLLVQSLWILLVLTFGCPAAASGADQSALFREDFDSLAQWEPLTFPKIPAHSTYKVVKEDGASFLKAESRVSASGIICRRSFNVYETPRLRWRWKVEQLEDRGNPKEKAGDDYPLRVYVMFPYDPDRATFAESLTYGAAKVFYGQYPPHSTLNYVWTGRNLSERMIASPYTDKAFMIVLEKGRERIGQWVEESIDILADYRKAFGKDPPAMARLAVMSDTDNAGGSAVAYMDFIEAGREKP
jgi:hypothetical protein